MALIGKQFIREHLREIGAVEGAEAALLDHIRGGGSGKEVRVAYQRRAAGAHGAENDFVLLVGGRLQHHTHAVRERPLRDADRVVLRFLRDRSRRRLHRHERHVADGVDIGGERCIGDRLDDRGHARLGRQQRAIFFGRRDEDETIVIRHPVPGERVDLRERDLGREPLAQAVLVDDAGNRLVVNEVADVFVRERARVALLAFGHRAFQIQLRVQLLASDLGLREAEARDASDLGEERRQPALHAVGRHQRDERRHFGRADQQPAIRLRAQERRVRLTRDFTEARGEQRAEQPLDDRAAVVADGDEAARRHPHGNVDARARRLRIRDRRVDGARARPIGDGEDRARLRIERRRNRGEVGSDQVLDHRLVDVADDDHTHQIRAIPILVELAQPIGIRIANDVRRADRQPVRIARPFQQQRELLVGDPLLGAEPLTPFLEDDAALLLDLRRVERDVVRPVLERQERAIDDRRILSRDLQLVDRLVEARVRVDVRAEAHAERLHEVDDVEPREVERAVERHVLDEVRETALVLFLEHRARVDDQPQLRARLRDLVGADVVAQAVRQPADRDLRIDGDDVLELRGGDIRRDGVLLGGGGRDRRRQRGQQQ